MSNEELTALNADRRRFLKVSAAGVAGALASVAVAGVAGAHAQVSESDVAQKASNSLGRVQRFYNSTTGQHFFTLNPGKFSDLLDGYSLEFSTAFYVVLGSSYSPNNNPFSMESAKKKPPKSSYSTLKFYCYTNAPYGDPFNAPDRSQVDYLYTTNDTAELSFYERFKNNDLGYVFSKSKHPDSSVPLYRFYNGSEHFYTAFYSEYQYLVNNNTGYAYEGVSGYVFPGNGN